MELDQQNASRRKVSFFIKDILEEDRETSQKDNSNISHADNNRQATDSEARPVQAIARNMSPIKTIGVLDLRNSRHEALDLTNKQPLQVNNSIFVHGQGFPFKYVDPCLTHHGMTAEGTLAFGGSFPDRHLYRDLTTHGIHTGKSLQFSQYFTMFLVYYNNPRK